MLTNLFTTSSKSILYALLSQFKDNFISERISIKKLVELFDDEKKNFNFFKKKIKRDVYI